MGIRRKIRKLFPCLGQETVSESRSIYVAKQVPSGVEHVVPETYPNNRIVSSKYTALNFLPKNLFEQFHRIANFYFLCVVFIMLVIDSPVSAWSSILPLLFVVSITAIKQGYEDWLRHKADKEVNHSPASIVRDGKLVSVKAMEIEVGDIVKVTMNQSIPCDMVMLSSTDDEGECSITTANLDGETNLKTFCGVSDTKRLQTEESFTSFLAMIECQQPITDLYQFIGRITLYSREDGSSVEREAKTVSLGPENVLLRGSRLKNTPFIFGSAIYTGEDTKVSLNSKFQAHKYSRVERRMNTFLITFLIILTVYSAVWVVLAWWFYRQPLHSFEVMWYIGYTMPEYNIRLALEEFLTFMVLCNYVIPISMYVTIEVVKFGGSLFFGWDVEMYDQLTNEPAKALTSDLNEELGQVEYLFTDKTGTLTENTMEFKQCSVWGKKYIEVGGVLCSKPDIPGVQPAPVLVYSTEIEEMLTVLALCHTVRVDKKDNLATGAYSENGFEYEYQASSPDEKALVEACRRYGVVYHGVRDGRMEITFKGKMRRYIMQHVLDFDPTRKRMSVIVRDEEGSVFLMSKGAETALLDRIMDGDTVTVEKHIDEYAVMGLRTLLVAVKKLTEEEFTGFDTALRSAKNALQDREGKLSQVYNDVERNFKLLGATAVEDQLQDGVPETISSLREAGIQVWVLTGDKEETAVNISYSAGHFYPGVLELRLTKVKNEEDCGVMLEEFHKILLDYGRLGEHKHALIIDGRSLVFALEQHKELLRDVCKGVVTVLCCRMSPIQKAEVVRLIKTDKSRPTTAAIGDGANDVSMIQEAHVGIGIMGKEGRQAVRSSDYAFGRFKFLKRALLVHGHYYYVRTSTTVQYFFYKNVAMITCQLYFTFFSAFSAQILFEGFLLAFYNITFCALPILLYGIFEKHMPEPNLEDKPSNYLLIRHNARLSTAEFIKWNILGLYHSLVFFFGVMFAYMQENAPSKDGKLYGVYDWGSIVMTVCVLTVNIKLMLESYHWNGIIIFGFALTFVGYFALVFLYSAIPWPIMSNYALLGTYQTVFASPSVWLCILVLVLTSLLPDILIRAFRDTFSQVYRAEKPPSKSKAEQYVTGQPVNLLSYACGSRLSSLSSVELLDTSLESQAQASSIHL